jgi:class 3 adenylate cyclase
LKRQTGKEAGAPATRPSSEEVRRRLLTRGGATENTSSLVRQFNAQYARTLGEIEAQRFSRDIPGSAPPLLEGTGETVMLSTFSRVAACSGYVSYLRVGGVIRAMPLFVKYKGRLYPQMDLALVCHLHGIDFRDIQISEKQVVLPRPGGSPIVIPIHTIHSPERGEVGAFLDIPWFGTDDWRTMYDYPAHVATRQHVPITQAWALADSRRTAAQNNAQAATAISFFADAGLNSARAFLQKPPSPADVEPWLAGAECVLTEAAPLAEQAGKIPPGERGEDEKLVLQHSSALRRAIEEDRRFVEKAAELRTALKGKTVLVGWTGTGTTDEWPTSLHSACPGVVIHSVVFNAIITGHFWHTAPRWVTALITAAIGLLTTYLLANAFLIFDYGNWIVGAAGPTVAATTVWATLTLARYVVESRERARITRRFQTYVDPSVVRYVIEHPELARVDGEEREMTVVFTDLAGFTSLAEQFRVKAVKILGRYISRMVPLIRGHRGLIHRFMGDGIMFSYGAPVDNPAHAAFAIATILEMQRAMIPFNEELTAEGYPALTMRGGVTTGLVMVGDSGAEDASEYACLGDTTNLAARLESANKMTGTSNLLSARTVEMVDGRFLVRPVGRLQVVGKKEWVMTYEALCETDSATEEQKRLAELTRLMVDAFIAREFDECLSAADSLDTAFGPSKLTSLYRGACRQAIAAPSSDFQGQIILQEK